MKPLQYLAANVQAIQAAGPGKKESQVKIFSKEVLRILLLFGPLIVALGGLLALLQSAPGELMKLLNPPSLLSGIARAIILVIAVLRLLYLWSFGSFLLDAWGKKTGWRAKTSNRGIAVFLSLLWLALPFVFEVPWKLLQRYMNLLPASISQNPTSFDGWVSKLLFLDSQLTHPLLITISLGAVLLARWILIHYVGDVAVYVNIDERTKNFAARSQILDECTSTLINILHQTIPTAQNFPRFNRIIVAGHSLGSVIAYDSLNQLLNRARVNVFGTPGPNHVHAQLDLSRLTGLVTFGSPLNKIYYFFREQVSAKQTYRRQLVGLLNSFRIKTGIIDPSIPATEKLSNLNPLPPAWLAADTWLNYKFTWINAWSLLDPVSGKLLFYDLQAQKSFPYRVPVLAHMSYWDDPSFYQFVISGLL